MSVNLNRGEYHIPQRTEAWFDLKAGRVSGSRVSTILGTETHQRTKNAIDSLALKLAIEHVYGYDKDDDFVSFDMQRGITLEPFAFRCFQERMIDKLIDTLEVGFVVRDDHSGASSDGICTNNWNLEIKSPNRINYFKLVANGLDALDPGYYDQMQMQMLCNETEGSYFANYYQEKTREFLHVLEVPRDDVRIKLIEERIEWVAELKKEYVSKLIKNGQMLENNQI